MGCLERIEGSLSEGGVVHGSGRVGGPTEGVDFADLVFWPCADGEIEIGPA